MIIRSIISFKNKQEILARADFTFFYFFEKMATFIWIVIISFNLVFYSHCPKSLLF